MFVRILIPFLILAAGFGAWTWLSDPVEEPVSEHQPRQRLKTERIVLSRTDYPVILETQGAVRAHHTTTITSLVPGTIRTVSPIFEDGAFFNEGDILAELDPADLQAAVTGAESNLARAEAALAQEDARAIQAKLNWNEIGFDEEPSPLVLRIPQLKEANAVVSSARADLDQALRNLSRAKIRAPFDGRVKSRTIGLGQAVGGTTPLGEVFATDFAEIRLPLTSNQRPFARLPNRADDAPVNVTLTDALAKDSTTTWNARIVRTEGALDEASRELFAIARIDDPFGLVSGNPELRIGQPVRAAVDGILLKDVFVIPRSALRGINRIYLIDSEEVVIKKTKIQPAWSTPQEIIVREGLKQGDWLASSRLPYAPDGAPVEIIEAEIASDHDDDAAGSDG